MAYQVKKNLAKRGLKATSKCEKCGEGDELVKHMLMLCEMSRKAWYYSPLMHEMDMVGQVK